MTDCHYTYSGTPDLGGDAVTHSRCGRDAAHWLHAPHARGGHAYVAASTEPRCEECGHLWTGHTATHGCLGVSEPCPCMAQPDDSLTGTADDQAWGHFSPEDLREAVRKVRPSALPEPAQPALRQAQPRPESIEGDGTAPAAEVVALPRAEHEYVPDPERCLECGGLGDAPGHSAYNWNLYQLMLQRAINAEAARNAAAAEAEGLRIERDRWMEDARLRAENTAYWQSEAQRLRAALEAFLHDHPDGVSDGECEHYEDMRAALKGGGE